jgi:hypothetical protein
MMDVSGVTAGLTKIDRATEFFLTTCAFQGLEQLYDRVTREFLATYRQAVFKKIVNFRLQRPLVVASGSNAVSGSLPSSLFMSQRRMPE